MYPLCAWNPGAFGQTRAGNWRALRIDLGENTERPSRVDLYLLVPILNKLVGC